MENVRKDLVIGGAVLAIATAGIVYYMNSTPREQGEKDEVPEKKDAEPKSDKLAESSI